MVTRRGRREVLASCAGAVAATLPGCTGGTSTESAGPDGSSTAPEPTGGSSATVEGTRTGADVRTFAHRGCAGQYPENTVLAVERSAPHVDVVEVDVQRCGSGELVVFHDERLDRLTDATGSVATTDWSELDELEVLDSGETIPRLSEVVNAVPSGTGLNVELKHAGMAAEALSIASEGSNETLYSSFSAKALRELRERDDGASLAYVFDDSPGISRSIAADVGCEAVHPAAGLVVGSDLVGNAHGDGFAVNAWTAADEETATRLVEAGVDGLFVDRWDVVR